ncbi:MAG: acyl carrier protein [Jiangellaceae bacterium]|uniref:Acyl carrier protein n=1 Tax=Microbacterium pygmaeum TaxID=370764 RepID=A0A1G8E3I0_9MICO|nr:acyl carrier protein [Microbacterium pygmaeum]SDH64290.1 Acyl carrier protein [Microbacterium pygmaeum]
MSESITSESAAAVSESPVALWLIDRIRFYDQVDAETITLDAPLTDLGLDSIYVLTLCGDIEDTYGLAIDPTFFADYATLGELADGLSARIDGK